MTRIDEVLTQDEGFYYLTYQSHPDSNEEFSYVNTIVYAQSSVQADQILKSQIRNIDKPEIQDYDLGIGVCKAINNIVSEEFKIETLEELRDLDTETVQRQLQGRNLISESEIREVGERKKKLDEHSMGEDVDDVIDVNRD